MAKYQAKIIQFELTTEFSQEWEMREFSCEYEKDALLTRRVCASNVSK